MVIDDFTLQVNRTKRQRKERTKKYIVEFTKLGNTEERSTDHKKLRSWLMGALCIDFKEFEDAIEELRNDRIIRIDGGIISRQDTGDKGAC